MRLPLLSARATASKYKSLIFRYTFQSLTLNSHSGISKLTLIIRQLYPCKNFDAVVLALSSILALKYSTYLAKVQLYFPLI